MQFFRSVAQALLDFNELNPIAPLQLLLEVLNSKKSLPGEMLSLVLPNMACYLDCLPLEASLGTASITWSALLTQLEILFRHLVLLLSTLDDVEPLLRIMVSVLKVPGIFVYKVSVTLYRGLQCYYTEYFHCPGQRVADKSVCWHWFISCERLMLRSNKTVGFPSS